MLTCWRVGGKTTLSLSSSFASHALHAVKTKPGHSLTTNCKTLFVLLFVCLFVLNSCSMWRDTWVLMGPGSKSNKMLKLSLLEAPISKVRYISKVLKMTWFTKLNQVKFKRHFIFYWVNKTHKHTKISLYTSLLLLISLYFKTLLVPI